MVRCVMNASETNEIDVPLNFPSTGNWKSNQFYDAQGKARRLCTQGCARDHQSSSHLKLTLRRDFIGWIHP